MQVLWARSPQRSPEIVAALAPVKGWHVNTVRTLLSRLVAKKAIIGKRKKKLTWFSPLISEGEFVAAESRSFLACRFDGSASAFVAHLLESHALPANELAELQKLLVQTPK